MTYFYTKDIIKEIAKTGANILVISDSPLAKVTSKITKDKQLPNVNYYFPNTQFDLKCSTTFHCKLYILKFEKILKILIGSGNILSDDFSINGNVFFEQEFQLKNEKSKNKNQFITYLVDYIQEVLKGDYENIFKLYDIDFDDY